MEKNIILDEYIDYEVEETIEENISFDGDLFVNGSLIRLDMNTIQYPLFSKNTRRKKNQAVKYYFNNNKNTYILVKPTLGNHIPGDFEEKVFLILIKIMKKKGFPKTFYVTGSEIKKELKNDNKIIYTRIKNAIKRLASTIYSFNNTLYSSGEKGILKSEVITPILTVEILDLNLKKNENVKAEFNDNRIKEVYKISITEHFYNNIVSKGYLVYDNDILLNISSGIARKIYTIIEKLRFNNSYLEINPFLLIKSIPLRYDKRNINRTIEILKNNFNILLDLKLIKTYKFEKNNTWEDSLIKIDFSEQSIENKQLRFFEDKNNFVALSKNMAISDTVNSMIDNDKIEEQDITKDIILEILNLMPPTAKKLKLMPSTIKNAIKIYGLKQVKKVAIYMKKNKVEKIRAYFIKALENNWVKDEELIEEVIKKEKIEIIESVDNVLEGKKTLAKIYYDDLCEEYKNKLEYIVKEEYYKKCGQRGKAQMLAFGHSKKSLVIEYIIDNELYKKSNGLKKLKPIEKEKEEEEKKVEIVEDKSELNIEELKIYIEDSIKITCSLIDLDESTLNKLKLSIFKDIRPLLVKKLLTTDEIDKIINKYTDELITY